MNELYGMAPETPIRLSITIVPARHDAVTSKLADLVQRGEAISVSFVENLEGQADIATLQKDIGLNLNPGSYSLILTVEDLQTGQRMERETFLAVRN